MYPWCGSNFILRRQSF